MATFKEMQDRTLDGSKRAGLTDVTEIKALLNQAYLEMSALVRPNVVDVSKTLTAGDGDYSISADWALSDVQAIRHITITDSGTSQVYDLERVMPDYVLMLQQNQTSAGGMRWWAQDGLDRVLFYPAPSTTTTNLTITYVRRPAVLVNDGDIPVGIPVEFHDTIVLGALARALRIWNPMYARGYHADYRQGLQEYRQWLNRQGGTWAPKAIVKGGRSNHALHDNSTDYSGMR